MNNKNKEILDEDMLPLWQMTRWAAFEYSDQQPPAVMFACKNMKDDDPDVHPIVLDYGDPRTSLQTAASLMNGGYEKIFFCFTATFHNLIGLGYMFFCNDKIQSGFATREKISEFGSKVLLDEDGTLIFPEEEDTKSTCNVEDSVVFDYIIFNKGQFFMEGISQDVYLDEYIRSKKNKGMIH